MPPTGKSELPIIDPKPPALPEVDPRPAPVSTHDAILQAAATIYASNRVQTYEQAVQHAIELSKALDGLVQPKVPAPLKH